MVSPMVREVTTDRHAELHTDRARLQAELEQARRR
jgi:hypothetical protein